VEHHGKVCTVAAWEAQYQTICPDTGAAVTYLTNKFADSIWFFTRQADKKIVP
jgi:hypothetical protein